MIYDYINRIKKKTIGTFIYDPIFQVSYVSHGNGEYGIMTDWEKLTGKKLEGFSEANMRELEYRISPSHLLPQ